MITAQERTDFLTATAYAHKKMMGMGEIIPEATLTTYDQRRRNLIKESARIDLKLKKLYELLDDYVSHVSHITPCHKGCSACCHEQVIVFEIEADYIQKNTGHKKIASNLLQITTKVMGAHTPCPFLQGGACSIYQFRPLACRNHVSILESSSLCDFKYWNEGLIYPKTSAEILLKAGKELQSQQKRYGSADIRDYFGW